MSMKSFLKRQPSWLQFSIYVTFVLCIFVAALTLISVFKSEEKSPQALIAPTLSQFKQVDSSGWSKPDFQEADRAIALFAKQCPAYLEYPNDVTLQKVSIESNDTHENLGWTRFVRIEVVAAESPKNLLKVSSHIYGNHCFQDIGVDGKPGMWVAKTACLKVCGGETKDPNSLGTFFPVASM